MLQPGPHPRRRARSRAVAVRDAVLCWLLLIGLGTLTGYSAANADPLPLFLGLAPIAVLGILGIVLSGIRTAVRNRDVTIDGPRLRESLRQTKTETKVFADAGRSVGWLIRLVLGVNAGIVVLALITGDWRILAWTLFGLAAVLVAGMVAFFASAGGLRRRPERGRGRG